VVDDVWIGIAGGRDGGVGGGAIMTAEFGSWSIGGLELIPILGALRLHVLEAFA
jgi:hypothetical protein